MNRAERRRVVRALTKQAADEIATRVQVRRTWAVSAASFVARAPLPARVKVGICNRLVRLAQMRVGFGPWQRLPVEITP